MGCVCTESRTIAAFRLPFFDATHTISILPPSRNQFTFVVVVVVANGLRRLDCLFGRCTDHFHPPSLKEPIHCCCCEWITAFGLPLFDDAQPYILSSVKERTTSLLLLRMGRRSHPSMHPILTSSEVKASSSFDQLRPFPSPKFRHTLHFQCLPSAPHVTFYIIFAPPNQTPSTDRLVINCDEHVFQFINTINSDRQTDPILC